MRGLLLLMLLPAVIADCVNECDYGARECSGDGSGFFICLNIDRDPCTEYSEVMPCDDSIAGTNDFCINGTCRYEPAEVALETDKNAVEENAVDENTPEELPGRAGPERSAAEIQDIEVQYVLPGRDLFFQVKVNALGRWHYATDSDKIRIDEDGYVFWTPRKEDIGRHTVVVTATDGGVRIQKKFVVVVQENGDSVSWHFEFWAMLGFFAVVMVFLYERRQSRLHRTATVRHIKEIEDIYDKNSSNPERCTRLLEYKRRLVETEFENGRVDERDMELILLQINKYQKELAKEKPY